MLSQKQKTLLEEIFLQDKLVELSLSDTEKISKQIQISTLAVEYFALEKGIWPSRYQRNRGFLDVKQQQRMLQSKAVVIGLGGLGGHVAEQIARLGLGEIVGVDPEVFDETNLNRQIFSNENNLGYTKADEAKKRLEMVNKAVALTFSAAKFSELNEDIWKDTDLVFDCLDNIEDRCALAKKCTKENISLVHGAIAGWYCQVGVVWPGTETLEKVYKGQHNGLEKSIGTPAFTAAVAASLMVAQGVKIIVDEKVNRKSELYFYDLRNNEVQTICF